MAEMIQVQRTLIIIYFHAKSGMQLHYVVRSVFTPEQTQLIEHMSSRMTDESTAMLMAMIDPPRFRERYARQVGHELPQNIKPIANVECVFGILEGKTMIGIPARGDGYLVVVHDMI